MKKVLASLALVASTSAHAFDLDSMQLANQLGTVLAAEEFCGLQFDGGAIEKFIDTKVSPNDLSFASTLDTMVAGSRFNQQQMTGSHKSAHCRQVARVARAYGFLSK